MIAISRGLSYPCAYSHHVERTNPSRQRLQIRASTDDKWLRPPTMPEIRSVYLITNNGHGITNKGH